MKPMSRQFESVMSKKEFAAMLKDAIQPFADMLAAHGKVIEDLKPTAPRN